MPDWLAESLRCTVFPAEHGAEVADFATAMGVEPDRRDAQPKLGVVRETAVLNDGVTAVALERLPALAHFRIGIPPEARMAAGVDLPELAVANAAFLDRAAAWLSALPHLSRLAYGAVLVLPVSARVDGYEVLDELLHDVKVDPGGSEDFRFQVNRPREIDFAAQALRINRLTKWSVRRVQLLTSVPPNAIALSAVAPDYHVMVDMDVNTAPGVGVLPEDAESMVELFKGLMGLGLEIAEKGDVP